MKSILSATLSGIEAEVVEVETTFTKGLPGFSIVGLANNSIQESRDRVKSALITNSFTFPPLKITINLSPSDLQKSGSHFDLPIALMIAMQNETANLANFFAFGELGLNGALRECSSIFPIILSLAKQSRITQAIIPKESLEKCSRIEQVEFFAYENLQELITDLKADRLQKAETAASASGSSLEVEGEHYLFHEEFSDDFIDVKGQESAKRAALIAACGMHNILFEGSPGCGKSMIAKRMRYILPPMSKEEILENAKILSIDGKEEIFRPIRPFRAPHHSSTKASIFGGGSREGKIGEIALASSGILFFDELPHFPKQILEALREPLEEGKLLISRVNSKIEYKTDFLFIGAMNPCPCGNLLSTKKECRCNELEIERYRNRLSEPFLDRIDLFVQMHEVGEDERPSLSSNDLFRVVKKAFVAQKKRSKNLNGKLSESQIEEFCVLSSEADENLQKAISRFGLSHRSINKIKKIARTIADIEESEMIERSHLLEALSFRRR